MEGGAGVGGRGTWRIKEGKRQRVQGRGMLENLFRVLRVAPEHGFLCVYGVLVDEGQRYIPIGVAALKLLFICLFKVKNVSFVFLGVSRRAFSQERFVCQSALISAI